jgi:hypothetical protein
MKIVGERANLWNLNKAIVCPKTRKKKDQPRRWRYIKGGSAIAGSNQGTCDDGHNTRRERSDDYSCSSL